MHGGVWSGGCGQRRVMCMEGCGQEGVVRGG